MKIISKQPSRISVADYKQMLSSDNAVKKPQRNDMRPEERLHRDCFNMLKLYQVQDVRFQYMFHSPNGGGRSAAESGVLKATGVRPGVPDFVLPFKMGVWAGAFIELKAGKNTLSIEQVNWLKHAEINGCLVAVVRSVDEFKYILDSLHSAEENLKQSSMPGYAEIHATKKKNRLPIDCRNQLTHAEHYMNRIGKMYKIAK